MVDLVVDGHLVEQGGDVRNAIHREGANKDAAELLWKGQQKPGIAGLCLMDMSLLCSLNGHLFKNISNLFFRRYCVDPP